MEEREIWKKYQNSNYEVSNLGNIRNIKTKRLLKAHFKYNGKVDNDYLKVSIRIDGEMKKKSVHRLVAECFLEDYSDELEVNHKNCVRYDNRVDNLEMCSREYNHNYSEVRGRLTPKRAVYTIIDGEKVCFDSLYVAAKYVKDIGKTNIKIDHVCNNIKYSIKNKNRYAYGFKWYDANFDQRKIL